MKRTGRVVVVVTAALVGAVSPAHARVCTHEVLPGESLGTIARRYHVSIEELRRRNRSLKKRRVLRSGQKLRVRTRTPCQRRFRTRYRVRRGDSVAGIAAKFRMKRWRLVRLNPELRQSPRLQVGQTLWVVARGPRRRARTPMYQLTEGPGYEVLRPRRAWGTFLAVTRLIEVLSGHARRFPDAQALRVGDLSRKSGGLLRPHRSHRRGRDVDIRFPLTIKTRHYVAATPKTLDVERTWDLIERFLGTNEVVYVFVDHRLQRTLYQHARATKRFSREQLRKFFQYPRGPNAACGIIRHEPGHATHMHVRFVREKRPTPTS